MHILAYDLTANKQKSPKMAYSVPNESVDLHAFFSCDNLFYMRRTELTPKQRSVFSSDNSFIHIDLYYHYSVINLFP